MHRPPGFGAVFALTLSALIAAAPGAPPPRSPDPVVRAAEGWLGTEYVFGGRNRKLACRDGGRRVRCRPGVDCQSLIFFAYEEALGIPWTRFSVMPSESVRRGRLGRPVKGLAGVTRAALDPSTLRAGDVLFFMLEGYNLEADPALWTHEGRPYGVWHTGLVHHVDGAAAFVVHAKPGAEVVIEPLEAIDFEAVYVLRR